MFLGFKEKKIYFPKAMNQTTTQPRIFPKEFTEDPKVAFVTATPSTTVVEICLLILLPVLATSLHAICFLIHSGGSWPRTIFFLNEQVFLVLPVVLGFTVLSDYLLILNISLFCFVIIVIILKTDVTKFQYFWRQLSASSAENDTSYISNYKAILQLNTALVILAVDFHVFPRRFAKSESFGIGAMDLGVGMIIMSMGLTSRAARGRCNVTLKELLSNVYSSLILIVLGCVRVALVKLTSYQEHVSEYGVHWNFFFTLSIVQILASLIQFLGPSLGDSQTGNLVISMCLVASYQLMLSKFDLADFIRFGANGLNLRTSFIDANREGIFSVAGFISLYFMGIFFGAQLFKRHQTPMAKFKWLFIWSLVMLKGMYWSNVLITEMSRQMSNMTYFFFIVAMNSILLCSLLLLQMTIKAICLWNKKFDGGYIYGRLTTPLFQFISRYQLMYFLLANVFTGVINKTVNTLECSNTLAIFIITGYMVALNISLLLIRLVWES